MLECSRNKYRFGENSNQNIEILIAYLLGFMARQDQRFYARQARNRKLVRFCMTESNHTKLIQETPKKGKKQAVMGTKK